MRALAIGRSAWVIPRARRSPCTGSRCSAAGRGGIGRALRSATRECGSAASIGWPFLCCAVSGTRALAWHEIGDHDRAVAALAEGLALAEKLGDDAFIPRYLNTIGFVRIDCGDFASGHRAVGAVVRGHQPLLARRPRHRSGASRLHPQQRGGRLHGAGRSSSRPPRLSTNRSIPCSIRRRPCWMTWRYSTHCHASLGQLALLRGDADGARRHAEQSLEMATPARSRKYESWGWRLKGESAAARRAWPEADDALRRALSIAQAIEQPAPDLAEPSRAGAGPRRVRPQGGRPRRLRRGLAHREGAARPEQGPRHPAWTRVPARCARDAGVAATLASVRGEVFQQ